MGVWVIRKPSDLRNVVTYQAAPVFLVSDAAEPDARRAWEEFFASFSMLEPEWDEPDLTTALIDAAAEPLMEFRDKGFQIVAVTSIGSMGGLQATQTLFVFAPDPFWFRADAPAAATVHLLGAPCAEGHQPFVDPVIAIRGWGSQHAVDEAFEHSIPWCPTCVLAE